MTHTALPSHPLRFLAAAGCLACLVFSASCEPAAINTASSEPGELPHRSSYPARDDADLRQRLSALEYEVACENGTEPPFRNRYWDNKEDGIYVDIISGVPLFSSKDKYDSGSGWPSFTQPLNTEEIDQHEDRKLAEVRSEVRSKTGNTHLGHVFDDGPAPTGLRYCINSASLRFIPKDKLEELGYGEFLTLFE